MADEKKYLDYAGLQRYDEKLKQKIAADDAKTLQSAKDYTDGKIGNLGEGIATVAAGILAEKTRAEGAESAINTKIGTVTEGKTVVEMINDAASTSSSTLYEVTDLDTIIAPKNGDVAVVSRTLTTGKVEKTAYQHNGNSWVALSDYFDADKVILTENITMAGNYTQVGNLTKSQNGTQTFATAGKSVAEALTEIFSKRLQPSKTEPAVSVTLNEAGAYEVGTKKTPTYTATLSAGSYTYGPATGINASTWEVTATGVTEAKTTATGSFDEITIGDDTNYTVTAKATYEAGAEAKDNLGSTSNPLVQIAAGDKSKTSSAITGYRNFFYGVDNETTAIDSAKIRSLTAGGAASAKTLSTIAASSKAGATRVIIAIPNDSAINVTKVLMPSAMNTDATTSFVKQTNTVAVEGANGYAAKAYKVWVYQPASLDSTETYSITLG